MKNNRGQTLVATLIVVTIIAALSVALWKGSGMFGAGGSSRKDGKGETVLGQTMYRAKDEVCRSNMNQVKLSIQVYTTSDEEAKPASLADLKLPQEFSFCPIGKEPYQYDPVTGKVTCPHPGHEKY